MAVNILTLEEALSACQTDNDFDNEIENALPLVDADIFTGTGFTIGEIKNKVAIELAKGLARVKLRLNLDKSTNPQQDISREKHFKLQLQAIMGALGEGILENE